MKKTGKLLLSRETLRQLEVSARELGGLAGGVTNASVCIDTCPAVCTATMPPRCSARAACGE